MTRQTTWTNADGLVVGFGPNFPERNVAGLIETDGVVKEARLAITYQSSGAKVSLPAGSVVLDVVAKVGSAWIGGTTVTVGDASSAVGFITAAQGATAALTAGVTIVAAGAYSVGDAATNKGLGKIYAAASDVTVTITGTYTAGNADVIVRYI
jgi:hypothetical protein